MHDDALLDEGGGADRDVLTYGRRGIDGDMGSDVASLAYGYRAHDVCPRPDHGTFTDGDWTPKDHTLLYLTCDPLLKSGQGRCIDLYQIPGIDCVYPGTLGQDAPQLLALGESVEDRRNVRNTAPHGLLARVQEVGSQGIDAGVDEVSNPLLRLLHEVPDQVAL